VIATAIICHALWAATATACRNEGTEIREPMGFAYSATWALATWIMMAIALPIRIRCRALYETSPRGLETTRRLTEAEADRLFPGLADTP